MKGERGRGGERERGRSGGAEAEAEEVRREEKGREASKPREERNDAPSHKKLSVRKSAKPHPPPHTPHSPPTTNNQQPTTNNVPMTRGDTTNSMKPNWLLQRFMAERSHMGEISSPSFFSRSPC